MVRVKGDQSTLHPVLILHTDGSCEGDFDGDRDIDGSNLGLRVVDDERHDCIAGERSAGDIDGDLTIGMWDLVAFSHGYGREDCPE